MNDTEIVSLGNYCLTTTILKNHNLKHMSYPFDWMVSCIDYVHHSISDDFLQFLNKDNYVYTSNSTKNTFYFNNIIKLWPSDVVYTGEHQHRCFSNKEDYDYINRCVKRFDELDKFNKIIFVMIQPLYLNNVQNENTKINELFNTLVNKFNNSNVILLIFNITKIDNLVYKENKINNNCYIYELESKIVTVDYGMNGYDKKGVDKFLEIIKSF